MSEYFVLDGTQVRAVDFMEWALWMEANPDKRIVKQEWLGGVLISTVFLGLKHNFLHGPPLLFETMVFHGKHDGYTARCSTWLEAQLQHAETMAMVLPSVSGLALVFGDFMRWRNQLLQRTRLRWAMYRGRHFGRETLKGRMQSFALRLRACLSEWRR